MKAIMSVDVEEWFHIPTDFDNELTFDKWEGAEQRVQHILPMLFDVFDENDVQATLFFLGWVAEKHPELVAEAIRRGHEVATHGYAHKLVYNLKPSAFKEDIHKAKSIIENISGTHVLGYRAPGFSITPSSLWALDILTELGFKYDSSVFPGKRNYGHFESFNLMPVRVSTKNGDLIEFPQTVVDFGFTRLSCFGGGYFRLFPIYFILKMVKIVERKGRPLIVYIHPHDLDIHQPRLNLPVFKRIQRYINVSKSIKKLEIFTSEIRFTSFSNIISETGFIDSLSIAEF